MVIEPKAPNIVTHCTCRCIKLRDVVRQNDLHSSVTVHFYIHIAYIIILHSVNFSSLVQVQLMS